jgi:hypothetical protein
MFSKLISFPMKVILCSVEKLSHSRRIATSADTMIYDQTVYSLQATDIAQWTPHGATEKCYYSQA